MTEQKKPTVLLVEDEAPAAMVLGDALKREGFEVVHANNGHEGLKTAFEIHPDIILTDLMMPEMTGLEMLQQLRQDTWGKHVEVIILTNRSDVSALEQAMNEGAFFYMVKGDSSMADVIAKVKSRIKAPMA